jgi:alkaline phosphatase
MRKKPFGFFERRLTVCWVASVNIGIVSQPDSAVRGVKDGENLKTILEYAEEQGLSTGVVSNDFPTGVASALVSAFYAHQNERMKSADIPGRF